MSEPSRKRSYDEASRGQGVSDGANPQQWGAGSSIIGQPSPITGNDRPESDNFPGGDWQLVEGRSKKKQKNSKRKKKNRNRDPSERPKAPEPKGKAASASSKGDNRPAVTCAELHKLNSCLRISDLQSLVLYCLADGVSPQWISVRHHNQIRKAVVLMIPGLEQGMFTGEIPLHTTDDGTKNGDARSDPPALSGSSRSPDDYLPMKLDAAQLPTCLHPFAEMFPQLFPIKAPGDDKGNRVHSPVQAMLNAPLTRSAEQKRADANTKGPKPVRTGSDWKDQPTPVSAFITSTEDLLENDYMLHPASCTSSIDKTTNAQRRERAKATAESGWKDAAITGLEPLPDASADTDRLRGGRKVLAMDCEMCKVAGDRLALTRVSVRDWAHRTLLDELVRPAEPIVDYLTAYSGITAERLAGVTTTLADVQTRLLDLFTPDSVLVGHSLNSDLAAVQMTHPYVVDTSILFPHPRGPPLKSSLRWLSQKYLGREIQRQPPATSNGGGPGGGPVGHDSVEDADACLDLLRAKCRHGPRWGTAEASGESIFRRLARTPRPGSTLSAPVDGALRDGRTGAVVDHGRPERVLGAAAAVSIGCADDDAVVAGIRRCATGDPDGAVVPGGGVDFVFARMRELEALRGWSTDAPPAPTPAPAETIDEVQAANGGPGAGGEGQSRQEQEPTVAATEADEELGACVARVAARVAEVRASLPPCTLLVVYSGVGDPRDMKRLADAQRAFRREFAVRRWDDLTVRWTDVEEQALRRAVRQARAGIGFVTVT